MERCTRSNGALSFLPGSHLSIPITKRFVRKYGGGTGFEDVCPPGAVPHLDADSPSLSAVQSYVLQTCEPGLFCFLFTQTVPDKAVAGDLVLIHGGVLHKSEKNTSSETRYAYTFHMIDSPPYAHYDEKNWLQPTSSMPFAKILDVPNTTTNEMSGLV